MGFDNECILNIQSLAGEYFCPVCRLLVYPNEALQSQCTHLYCKPCLTYITSTTRACPYDGYLVTEADSKPLTESNKALAETIGKITVHCLYHRSGCTWQGPLSECTSHCSGCAFGNSPVVCNRCGIQIVHRQVQEHAQNCPVVQTQAHGEGVQDATATATTPAGDHTQVATQAGTAVTQAHSSQTTASSVPGQDSNQQGNPTTQPQSVVQAVVPTAEQWYQQQQQYQQYYQQYPGFDPYLQHYQQYYPYQQQAVQQYSQPQASQPQSQGQPQGQLQTQPQSHPYIQLTANQPQSLPQANSQQQIHSAAQPQSQMQSQTHPPTQGQLRPQPQLLPQTLPVHHHPQHVPVPQYQQPHSQIQHLQTQVHPQHPVALPLSQGLPHTHAQPPVLPPPQPYTPQLNQPVNPHLQPQPQHSSAHAVTGHHSYPQPQSLQQMQPGGQQHPAHLYPQGGLQLQSQYSVQMQNQLLQRPPPLRPSQSHVPIQNPQQSGLFPSSGQVPGVPPSQQQPVYSNAHQPGVPAHQRPVMQSAQQPIHQQYVQQQQQPFAGQAPGSVHNQVHQQGAYAHQQMHVQSQLRPQGPSPSFQQPYQAQNVGGKPMMPPHGVPVQPHPHSSVGMQVKPMQVGTGQQSGNSLMINNPAVLSSEQHLGATSRSMSDRQSDHIIEKDTEAESTSQKNYNRTPNDVDVARGLRPDSNEVKTIKSEGYLKPLNDDKKPIDGEKDTTESPGAENGERSLKVKEEPTDDTDEQEDISNADYKQVELSVSEGKEMKDRPPLKTHQLQEGERFEDRSMKLKDINLTPQPSLHGQVQGEGLVQPSHLVPIADQGKQHAPPIPHGPTALQQWPVGPGQSHHMQLPGHSSAPPRPVGTENIPHSGQPLRLPAENLQQPPYKQPYGPEVSPAGIAGQGSASVFERGQSHYGSQGPYAQGEQIQSYARESDMFTNQRPNSTDGRRLDPLAQQSGRHSNAMRMNGAPGTDSSPALGLQGDRFRPLPEEHLNPFPQDPAQRMFERREFEDLKLFPRPSHLDNESSRFLSSRPLDRRPHGFGMDKPLDKGQHGLNYESGMKLETLGGPAPSRFFPPHPHDGIMHSSELGERPLGFHDKTLGRQPDSGRTHHDFFGPVPRHDMAPRSPVREYPGVPSHGFGALPGLDDVGGRELRRFGDSFRGSRYPVLPNHFHRGEFEGPGQDGFPSHLRRDEHLGPHNLHGRFGEPIGFDACPGPARIGELPGPGNFFHAQLGGPGFRSSFSHKGFPSDGGNYARDLESFDNSRRRKPSSMGWCRICKIDCETVEGLDLHSQTREHQNKTMDMVVTIKQNAKKQKIASSDRSSLDDTSKSKNASFEGCGNKN